MRRGSGLPLIVAEGRCVADPEVKFAQSGKAWVRCRIACTDRVRDGNGVWSDGESVFLDVVCFGQTAENLAESAGKGDKILVVGHLECNDYTDREGVTRTNYKIMADEIGPSIDQHPAKIVKAAAAKPAAAAPAANDDPWATPQGAVSGPVDINADEPPF